ncbi:MAG: hypothetical protein PHD21_08200 [Flavobacteriales bacterium]|nr:hypothetical protein [Flavobacteriales bacterium]
MKKIILYLITILCIGCTKENVCPPLPKVKVEIVLYTVFPEQNPQNKGFIICKGKNAGYGGVVVVTAYPPGTYRAFELSAPHLPRGVNTILTVDEQGLKAICPADGAEFMLSTGMPLVSGTTTSPCGLIEYSAVSMPSEGIILIKN